MTTETESEKDRQISTLLEENKQLKLDIAELWSPEDDREIELLVQIADLEAKVAELETKADSFTKYRRGGRISV